MNEVDAQRAYYAGTAAEYGRDWGQEGEDRRFTVNLMLGAADYLGVRSVLEIGAATGNVLGLMKKARPALQIKGIEPVTELRAVGHRNGFSADELVDGDGLCLKYGDGEFDLVCAFAVLHHVRTPARVVAEMLRVARKAVFIVDSNNFGQGSALARFVKQALNGLGLWPAANFVKTRGKGFTISEGDGLAYSYSLYNDLGLIERHCERVHIMNVAPSGINPYRSSSGVALLGIKHL